MKGLSLEDAKEFQKHAVIMIELMIDRMRYDKKTELTILDVMNLRDSVKSKKFVSNLTKQKIRAVSEEKI